MAKCADCDLEVEEDHEVWIDCVIALQGELTRSQGRIAELEGEWEQAARSVGLLWAFLHKRGLAEDAIEYMQKEQQPTTLTKEGGE